jgi:monofunctional biosynthetic peptidoglycan transglycosylase
MHDNDHFCQDWLIDDRPVSKDNYFKKKETSPTRLSRFSLVVVRSALAAIYLSVALVLCLRWVPPPTSAVMIETYLSKVVRGAKNPAIRYQWANWESISPHMALAVVAAEDQEFPHHWGFDFQQISKAIDKSKKGGRLRGASTISQQVAKNLFLWSGRSYIRKGLEAYFTVLLESLWPKRRLLEVYLNIAEFGDGVYGVHAASTTFFRKKPSQLSRSDVALLAAVLPNPKEYSVRHPSRYVLKRQRWIKKQMKQLGGVLYLHEL